METNDPSKDEKDRLARAYQLLQAAARIKAAKLNLPASSSMNPYEILTHEEIEEVTESLNLPR
jgi:hypothetical protein